MTANDGTASTGGDPIAGDELDPRPVFAGSWATATGKERQAHMVLVNAWKARHGDDGAKAQSRMAAPSGQPATSVAPTPSATEAVLVAIRDDANAHDSDRIRAAQALISMEREAAATTHGPSPLVALRECLNLLAPDERLAWLQGERIAHMHAGEVA